MVVAGGLILVSIVHWLIGAADVMGTVGHLGPRGWARLAVGSLFSFLMLALFVRVIGSWLGLSEFKGVMRVVIILTEWMIDPIRRFFPPVGLVDFSPMVAWLLLWMLRGIVLSFI
jgi:YggT family protein